ncbi:MAG: hypothetical protein EXS13_09365 [Planctomycetes bacterium]|nr:hypothetical protein [Planctomycetota bacterium]
MCTLTIVDRPNAGYRLVMTRDERRTRLPGRGPAVAATPAGPVVAPRDGDAGGSWIVADAEGRTWCILNGDAIAEGWNEPADVRSRGALIFELLSESADGGGDAVAVAVDARLAERARNRALPFRPFQLVLVERATERAADRAARGTPITHWRFDGAKLRVERGTTPWIGTSNGFDPAGVARERRRQFEAWLAVGRAASDVERSLESQLELHRSHVGAAKDGALASFCLHRPEVASVSVTAVEVGPDGVTMRYEAGAPCARAAASEVHLPCS